MPQIEIACRDSLNRIFNSHQASGALKSLGDFAEKWNMTHAWFVFANEVVSGPFDTQQVQTQIKTGQLPPGSLIWWRGQREWMPLALWENHLAELAHAGNTQEENRIWYLDMGENPIGPLTQSEVIDNLKSVRDLSGARLWTTGMKTWTKAYEVHDIMEPLGISRRTNKRAPLVGTVAIARSNEDPRGFVVKAASISIAGIGIVGQHDLRKGDIITLMIKSAELPGNIHLQGEVAYVTSGGYAGIRFEKVPAETQSLLYDYVKRFNPDQAENRAA